MPECQYPSRRICLAKNPYETPDHTGGEFRSQQEAKDEIEQSVKEHKISRKEHVKDSNGRVIGDQIVCDPASTRESVHGHPKTRV
jgi:hypothetical protein